MIHVILEVIDHAMALLKITKRKIVAKDHSDPLVPLELLDLPDLLNLLVHHEREDPTNDQLDQLIHLAGEVMAALLHVEYHKAANEMAALLHVEHHRTVSESRAMRYQRD